MTNYYEGNRERLIEELCEYGFDVATAEERVNDMYAEVKDHLLEGSK